MTTPIASKGSVLLVEDETMIRLTLPERSVIRILDIIAETCP